MKANFLPTNDYYHAIINTSDKAEKERLYIEKFITPWKPMMSMMGGDADDAFAVARQWAWLLPENLADTPVMLHDLEAAHAWQKGADALAKGIARFEADTERIPIETVTGWLIIADPARSSPIGRGYTGAIDFTQPSFVVQCDAANDYVLSRLQGAIVHEFNHLVRLRIFPWNMATTSVADYIIHEGLAESFAAALFGEDVVGYYVTDISAPDLEVAKGIIGAGLDETGFNVIRGYIFGDSLADQWGFDKIGMPDYGGYAVGYHVVQAFLKRTGKSIEEATFTPALDIIAQSGYFDFG